MDSISTRPGPPPPAMGALLRVVRAYPVPGYLPGLRQAVVVVELAMPRNIPEDALRTLDALLATALPGLADTPLHTSFNDLPALATLVRATQAILDRAGVVAVEEPKILGAGAGEADLRLALPAHSAQQETLDAFGWAASLMNLVLEGRPVEEAMAVLPKLEERIRRKAPPGMNTRSFLAAAHEAGIPWRHVSGNVFQFGWGSQARWLDSTFTDATSVIATGLARDKRAAAQVMRAAGLPVPPHELAGNADHAVRIAAALGYPVVVKPADLDGGRGVSAGLRTEAAVRAAYDAARLCSAAVLVEKHVEGNDYRVQVFNGEVYWVAHRVPGGVTGDGKSTVSELLAVTNAHPLRGEPGTNALLKRIYLDAEANELLTELGMTAESVPAADQFVRLRRAANVASGGIPVAALEKAHPDNLALGVRAARVLGLDLAGIDLLIPDIARSWLETGAGICEVNAQPQISPHLPAFLLRRLLPTSGRIPVVVVLGEPDPAFQQRLADALAHLGRVGTASEHEVRVGGQVVSRLSQNAFQAGLALLTDRDVDVAVIGLSGVGPVRNGMPVDGFDALVLAGPPKAADKPADWKQWHAFAQMLAPLCRGGIILNRDCSPWQALAPRLNPKQLVSTSFDGLPQAVRQSLDKPGHELTRPDAGPR